MTVVHFFFSFLLKSVSKEQFFGYFKQGYRISFNHEKDSRLSTISKSHLIAQEMLTITMYSIYWF